MMRWFARSACGQALIYDTFVPTKRVQLIVLERLELLVSISYRCSVNQGTEYY